ncbi:MAG: signal peptidase I [Bdellovibrionales bacterium]|nr:signal peptidase I [Bdellovibrionales bacterium]
MLILLCILSIHLWAKQDCNTSTQQVIVNGTSMSPLFKDKQELKVIKNYYSCHDIQRGDIIVFEQSGRKNLLIKSVIAIPGDKFEYKNLQIYINGKIQKNSSGVVYSIKSKMLSLYSKSYPVLPKDSYLVLGDNPQGTLDASAYGLIGREQIQGKVQTQP